MRNQKTLGIINTVLGIIFTLPLVLTFANTPIFDGVAILSLVILAVFPAFNFWRGLSLFNKNYKVKDFGVEWMMTLLPLFWIILSIGLYLLSGMRWIWVAALISLLGIGWVLYRHNKVLMVAVVLIQIFLIVSIFGPGVEEAYCWQKGDSLGEEKNKISEEVLTVEEKKELGIEDYPAKGYLEHMRCHKSYKMSEAVMSLVSGKLEK